MSTDLLTDESCGLRERKKRETRRALNLAALDLVEEKGFAAVTTEEIAARAGVSARTFFNYFPSKEAAVIGTTAEELEAYAASLEEDTEGESPLGSLRRILAGMLAPTSIDRELRAKRRRILLGEPSLAPALVGNNIRIENALTAALSAASASGPGPRSSRASPWPSRSRRCGPASSTSRTAGQAAWSATSTRPSTGSLPACAEHRPVADPSAAEGGSRVSDAGAGRRPCPEPLVGDRVAAHLAATVGPVGDALEGGVDLGEVLLGLLDQRADLGALVGDRRSLGVVLVIGDVGLRGLDDLGELST